MSIDELRRLYGERDGLDLILPMVRDAFPGRIAVISSFGAESAVLLDLVAQIDRSLPVLFLDTGEMFDETLAYRDILAAHLGLTGIRVVRPDPADLDAARDLWESDPDRCCELRKVRPLAAAVLGFAALIDGRKRAHGFERGELGAIQAFGEAVKISPLWSWSDADIAAAFAARGLPAHPLVARGYRSVGCWPCTRPTAPGEPARAGRWPGSAKTECGIHVAPPSGITS